MHRVRIHFMCRRSVMIEKFVPSNSIIAHKKFSLMFLGFCSRWMHVNSCSWCRWTCKFLLSFMKNSNSVLNWDLSTIQHLKKCFLLQVKLLLNICLSSHTIDHAWTFLIWAIISLSSSKEFYLFHLKGLVPNFAWITYYLRGKLIKSKLGYMIKWYIGTNIGVD